METDRITLFVTQFLGKGNEKRNLVDHKILDARRKESKHRKTLLNFFFFFYVDRLHTIAIKVLTIDRNICIQLNIYQHIIMNMKQTLHFIFYSNFFDAWLVSRSGMPTFTHTNTRYMKTPHEIYIQQKNKIKISINNKLLRFLFINIVYYISTTELF